MCERGLMDGVDAGEPHLPTCVCVCVFEPMQTPRRHPHVCRWCSNTSVNALHLYRAPPSAPLTPTHQPALAHPRCFSERFLLTRVQKQSPGFERVEKWFFFFFFYFFFFSTCSWWSSGGWRAAKTARLLALTRSGTHGITDELLDRCVGEFVLHSLSSSYSLFFLNNSYSAAGLFQWVCTRSV